VDLVDRLGRGPSTVLKWRGESRRRRRREDGVGQTVSSKYDVELGAGRHKVRLGTRKKGMVEEGWGRGGGTLFHWEGTGRIIAWP